MRYFLIGGAWKAKGRPDIAPGSPPPTFPPVVNAGADQSATTGGTVTLTGTATNSPTSYHWAQTAGPAVALSNPNALSTSFTAPATAGTLVFAFTATNVYGTSSPDSVSIMVSTSSGVVFTHGSQMPAALAAGQIGLKPGVPRTTVQPFTPQSGQTYQNLTIDGSMTVDASCTFINCQFLGDSGIGVVSCNWNGGDQSAAGTTTARFEYCEFDGQNQCDMGINGYNVYVYRSNFRRSLKDLHINDYIEVVECHMGEHWRNPSSGHRECVLRIDGDTLTVLRSWIVYEDVGSLNTYVSSAFSAYNQGPCRNVTVDDCWIDGGGGGWAFYGGGGAGGGATSNTKLRGCIFGRAVSRWSGYAGPVETAWLDDPGAEFSGNRWGPLGPDSQAGDPAEGTLLAGQLS